MQVRELVDLARFLNTFVTERALIASYDRLIAAVTQASQNQNPQNVAPRLAELLALHDEANKQVLSPAQSKLFDDFGGSSVLGGRAADRIRQIFDEHQAHPQGVTAALEQLKNETTGLTARATQFVTSLEPMLDEVIQEDLEESEGRLWLSFAEAAQVDTIEGLEKAADSWKQVLQHFARMPGATAGGRILSISKHSPLELELAAHLQLLVPLAFGISWLLKSIEQVIDIRKKAEELKQMQIKPKIVTDLHKEADILRDKITKEAADEVKQRFKTDGEARNAAKEGLTIVLSFIERGGVLDIDLGEDAGAEEDNGDGEDNHPRVNLRQLVEKIRKEIRLLPPPPVEPKPDEEVARGDSEEGMAG